MLLKLTLRQSVMGLASMAIRPAVSGVTPRLSGSVDQVGKGQSPERAC